MHTTPGADIRADLVIGASRQCPAAVDSASCRATVLSWRRGCRLAGQLQPSPGLPWPLSTAPSRPLTPDLRPPPESNSLSIEEIDRLLDDHTYGEICQILNEKGLRSGQGHSFCPNRICKIRRAYRLKGRYDRLREKGLLTLVEAAEKLHAHPESVKRWRRMGLLKTQPVDDSGRHLYDPTNQRPDLRRRHHVAVEAKEVQCEC